MWSKFLRWFEAWMHLPALHPLVWVVGIFITAGTASMFALQNCGPREEVKVVAGTAPDPTAPVTCEGAPLGTLKDEVCPSGQTGSILKQCQASGSFENVPGKNTCKAIPEQCVPAEGAVTFNRDILPLTQRSCSTCHNGGALGDYSKFADVSKDADKMLDAIKAGRMPKPGYQKFDAAETAEFEAWIAGGKLEGNEECQAGQVKFTTLPEVVADSTSEALRRNTQSRFVRFLDITPRLNLGVSTEEVATYKAATNKALNLLSLEDEIVNCSWVGRNNSICAFDYRDLGWVAKTWEDILKGEPINITFDSVAGRELVRLTGTQQPILHAEVFMQFGTEKQTYYDVTGIPATLKEYFARQGINFEQNIIDTINGNATDPTRISGTSESPLGNNHRMIVYFPGKEGECSITFDTDNINAANGTDIFKSPLIVVANALASLFQGQAGEVICPTANGFQEYALYAIQSRIVNGIQIFDGARQLAAPEEIVSDYSPDRVEPTISNADSCENCHHIGPQGHGDEVVQVYRGLEVDVVQALYATAEERAKILGNWSARYQRVLRETGNDPAKPSGVTFATKQLRKNQSLDEFCAFIWEPKDRCIALLQRDGQTKDSIGGLANGQTVAHNSIVDLFSRNVTQKEFRIGQDPLGGRVQ